MPRRNRIPLEHRERIVRAFEDEQEDYLLVADTLGVNRSTARGIVARYITEGRIRERPRGGRNNVRVDDEMRDCLEQIINENCLLTLAQICISEKLPKTALCIFKSARISDNLQPQNLCHRVKNVWTVFVCLISISMVSS